MAVRLPFAVCSIAKPVTSRFNGRMPALTRKRVNDPSARRACVEWIDRSPKT
jgi:hypothetical protein